MKVRRYKSSDAVKVDEIYNRCHGHYNLPDINRCLQMAVVENDEGEIIAFGAIQMLPELVLVLDNDRSKKEQVKALKELMSSGESILRLNGHSDAYAFPDSNTYSDILKKHFGFKDCQPLLIKKVD